MSEDGEIPTAVRAAGRTPGVIAALADLFRRNCRAADGTRRPLGPGDAEALARHAVERLLHPDTFGNADVGGLRLHLEVASDLYAGESRIHASAWDDDAQVWRTVGEVGLAVGP